MLGILDFQLNFSMITPALPDMAMQLNVIMAEISRVSSLFFLSGSICSVFLSCISDFLGRRNTPILIMTMCGAGTVICTLTTDLYGVLFGRILQVTSSKTVQLAYLLLHNCLNRRLFGTAISIITSVNGVVGEIDGHISGLLNEKHGYQSIFIVTFAVCVLALIAAIFVVKHDEQYSPEGKIDWLGAAVLSLSIILSIFV